MIYIPPIIKNLLIINGLMWICWTIPPLAEIIDKYLILRPIGDPDFKVWQFITHMFVHSPQSMLHIFVNMIMLWMFGREIEHRWGQKRFLQYYILCELGAGIIYIILKGLIPGVSGSEWHGMLGASGAISGVYAAYGMIWPNRELMLLFPPMPIKGKYLVLGLIILSLAWGQYTNDNIAHYAHLGGLLTGLLIFLYWKIKGVYY